MNILITGGSGFLGNYVSKSLRDHDIAILGRKEGDQKIDIRQAFNLNQEFEALIHLAGKAHSIPGNEREEQEFFEVNLEGTKNVLQAMNPEALKKIVYVSSVAVYGRENGSGIDEEHALIGSSPYALSKIQAEQEVIGWATKHEIPYLVMRVPLIVGEQPPGNLGAMIQAMKRGRYFRIGKADARKSMVHAEDLASLIEAFVSKDFPSGTFNLTDGVHPSFRDVENYLAQELGISVRRIPKWIALILSLPGLLLRNYPLSPDRLKKITSELSFDDTKARSQLAWSPGPALRGRISI